MGRAAGWLLAITLVAQPAFVGAAEKPDEIVIGITSFSSGPASVFGEPANAAAEMMVEEINEQGGIDGVPIRLIFIDEGAGGEHVVSEYRRVVQEEGADVMAAAISSGTCNQVVPLAEDLKVLNIMWDCGTQRIFEEGQLPLLLPHPGQRYDRNGRDRAVSA